jgi:hypothetical protein
MSLRKIALLLAGLLAPTWAHAQKTRVDYDHGASFDKYRTHKWVKGSSSPEVSQLAEQRIVSAIDEAIAKKGLRRVENDGDLAVRFQASVQKQTQLTTYSDGIRPGWGPEAHWGYGWGGSSISTTTADVIPVGSLVVDMMDPVQKQFVFRGMATDTLSDKPEKNAKKITKAVNKIFEKYFPKEKS